MPDWSAMFAFETPVLELIVRGTVIYLALLAMLRVTGQREAGGVGITDLVVVVLIAEAVTGGVSAHSSSLVDGLVVVATILAWSVAVDAVAYRSPLLARLIKGRPKTLVDEGRLDRRVLRSEFMTDEELRMYLRVEGIESLAEVRTVVLEPNGMISVVKARSEA